MNITDAVFDPELGCTAFTVERITYTRSRSGTTSRSATAQALGTIHPGTPEMIQLLPEEEREEQFIAVYTDFALSTGTPESSGASFMGPDRIHWGGKVWRVVRVRDWQMFGYYQAYAVLMRETL
ncbi:MAG: hypothetical protein IKG23_13840 [Clostridia bacterium]|nr:hypothetical protein [Clostridia bacterium]